jgi:hypothetical protein
MFKIKTKILVGYLAKVYPRSFCLSVWYVCVTMVTAKTTGPIAKIFSFSINF